MATPTPDPKLAELQRSAQSLKLQRERIYTVAQEILDISSKDVTDKNHHMFVGDLDRLTKIQADYDNIQQRIVDFNIGAPKEFQLSVTSAQKSFDQLVRCAQMNLLKFRNSGDTPVPAKASETGIKLPPIAVPQFSGDPSEWATFLNIYNAAVHNNQAIPKVVKLSRLMTYLSGEPRQMIGTMEITDANYDSAYTMLLERYHNKKKCILTQYTGLLNLGNVGTPAQLSKLLARLREHMHALDALGHPPDKYSPMLVAILYEKLSADYRRRLDDFRASPTDYPDIDEIIDFLKAECALILDNPTSEQSYQANQVLITNDGQQKPDSRNQAAPPQPPYPGTRLCSSCRGPHLTFQCESFNSLTVSQRRQEVKKKNLCFNCLSDKHQEKNCTSKRGCRVCNRRHHSMLHMDTTAALISTPPTDPPSDEQPPTTSAFAAASEKSTTVLPTAQIVVSSPGGTQLTVRALFDCGAQNTFMTSRTCALLGLKPYRSTTAVTGLSQNSISVEGNAFVNLLTRDGRLVRHNHPVIVIKNITSRVPSAQLTPQIRTVCSTYPLADPTFDAPGYVDVLLGCDVLPYLITGEKVDFGASHPTGLGTVFGIMLLGPAQSLIAPDAPEAALTSTALLCQTELPCLRTLSEKLEKFWELEEVKPSPRPRTPEEEAAERFYEETTIQQPNGRYQVRLPFKENHPPLGNSRNQAENRFRALERRLTKDPAYKEAYVKFMREYEANKFMTKLDNFPPTSSPTAEPCFYLPHHGVFRESSSTTKLRVVMDGSAASHNGVSLNNIVLPGPKLQNDIRSILINFRRHKVVFSADIRQMFLQIDLHPDDRKYQLILWRESPEMELCTYSLNTVSFGVCCSPFLAIRTILQLVKDHGHKYPDAARTLLEAIFVDDICDGDDNVQLAKLKLEALIALLALGGFSPRKWTSNCPELLEGLPVEDLELPCLDDPENPSHGILGVTWLPRRDSFTYRIHIPPPAATKRGILSAVASIYDPCGWIAPTVFLFKSFLQELWRLNIAWDDPLPAAVKQRWENCLTLLPSLKEVSIPRLMHMPGASSFQLHGFCDGSELGYCAVLYLRSAINAESPAEVNLVMAKTRVAPLKRVTLPRLELCSATLLARMLKDFLPQLRKLYNLEEVRCWSDSTVTLSWIEQPAYRLKTFVGNRVITIQEVGAEIGWSHVRSLDNPADCGTRGVPPDKMSSHPLWWRGPAWLSEPKSLWPIPLTTPSAPPKEALSEMREPATVLLTNEQSRPELFPEFSSWSRAIRVLGWIARFVKNCKSRDRGPIKERREVRKFGPQTHPPTTEERTKAQYWLLKYIQKKHFADDIKCLRKKAACSRALQTLNPFIDDKGLVRVGGRLRHADLSEDARHPILLPAKEQLVRLLIRYYHFENLHAAPRLLQATLGREFWIIAARQAIRACVHKCVVCFKTEPRQPIPLMGDLPRTRVTPSPPFAKTGMDYAGPFQVKIHQLRSAKHVSAYLCIFVCFATKAVHLEVASELTSRAFIRALERFTARRGRPTDLFSDCGKNFIGASNHLEKLVKDADGDLKEYLQRNTIKFHFQPPSAPHQGGLWEAAVKSAKRHLSRVIGNSTLTLEEFQTLCCRTEAMLNSRPLTPMSSDPNDLQPLTPGHFLIGRPMNSIPAPEIVDEDLPKLQRWYLIEGMFQSIWRRWSAEYLQTLQPRGKWTQDTPPLAIGKLVLIQEPNSPPLAWALGRIVKIHPGADERVRVATVRTPQGKLLRPVHRLFPLPLDDA